MESILIVITVGIMSILNLIGMSWIYREVKKGNKDQQEIKTKLTWIKKRQLANK